MSDFHGTSLTQYVVETAGMLLFGAFITVVGALLVLFPNASAAQA